MACGERKTWRFYITEALRENLSTRKEQSAEPQRGTEGRGQKIFTGFDKVRLVTLTRAAVCSGGTETHAELAEGPVKCGD